MIGHFSHKVYERPIKRNEYIIIRNAAAAEVCMWNDNGPTEFL